RGLVGTALVPKGPLPGGVSPDRDLALRARLGPTEHAYQGIEQLLHGPVLDGLLRNLDVGVERGKERAPPQILSQRAETRPRTVQCGTLGHSELLSLRGGEPHR